MACISKRLDDDIIEYIYFLKKACKLGNKYAYNYMGVLYSRKIRMGSKKKIYANRDKSRKYYAKSTLVRAKYNLALSYYKKKDYELAYSIFANLYKAGFKEAGSELGDMYYNGEYVEKDYAMAYKIYRSINSSKIKKLKQIKIDGQVHYGQIFKLQAIIKLKDYFNNDLTNYIMEFY